jgi:hypothetical protein
MVMSIKEKMSLESEITQLQLMLRDIPQENVIDRLSFKQRLEDATKLLSCFTEQKESKKARLTFRGTPVIGSHGIVADFAAKASLSFTDAVAAVAAGLSDQLRYMGPIPNRNLNQLLITGIAVGSFGFEFEMPSGGDNDQLELLSEPTMAELAVDKVKALFELSAIGTDDDITDLVDEIHPRAVRKVYDFLDQLLQNNAWCGLEFEDNYFKYQDIDQLSMSVKRLKADNIKEVKEAYSGEFLGILPTSRNFEFKTADQTVIRGKIGPEIEDADILNKDYLHKPVTTTFSVIQVGHSRPRFTLENLQDVKYLSKSN